MQQFGMVLCVLFACLALASCAANQGLVVLLPEAEGKAGQVVVSNRGGAQVLKEAGQAVGVRDYEHAPLPPEPVDDENIRVNFGEALAVLPQPPLHFILYFKTDTTELTLESRKLLAQVLPAVAERKSMDVGVVGHTDRVGTREYNYRLGMERALLIKNVLVEQGIGPSFIEVESHGEDNPLIAAEDEVAEPRNRRVEVVVR